MIQELGRTAEPAALLAKRPDHAYQQGRLAEACEAADHAVFWVLNVMANYLDDEDAKAVLP